MSRDYLGVVFSVVGLAAGHALGGTTTGVLAALVGFFFGKVVYSLTKTVEVE